jgi:NAD(P)-dependent dehydrogenase (short-subunit alcohol dehydrogenase family)
MTEAITVSPTRREPQLLGQTVVVIGGSSGIGFETARRARAEGAEVILTGRNPERLQQAALALGALSRAAFDATDFDRLKQFFDELDEIATLVRGFIGTSRQGLSCATRKGVADAS